MAINDRVKELGNALVKAMEPDTANKSVKTTDGVYEANLPEGLTMPIVTQVSEYNTDFVAASAYAFGQVAVKAMAADKTLDQLTGTIPMAGKDAVHHTIHREKTYANALGGGDPIVKQGVMVTTLETRAGKNGGQLKAARNEIGSLAAEAFK